MQMVIEGWPVTRASARDRLVVGPSLAGWVRVAGVEGQREPPRGNVAAGVNSDAVLLVKLAGGFTDVIAFGNAERADDDLDQARHARLRLALAVRHLCAG